MSVPPAAPSIETIVSYWVSQGSAPQPAPLTDFSLVLGGPAVYQLWRRTHLTGEPWTSCTAG